jgi:hypothetical protein
MSDVEEEPAEEESSPDGFKAFEKQKSVSGILFKLNPVSSDDMALVEQYVRDGMMQRDFEYAYEVHTAVNFSLKRDFSNFWESPWAEDQVRNTHKRKRVDEQQKALAVASFIKASSVQDPESAEAYIQNVNRMMQWEDKNEAKEIIKTVSRMVQAHERKAIRSLMDHDMLQPTYKGEMMLPIAVAHIARLNQIGGINVIAHTLRRSPLCFDAFAQLVAHEILISDNTTGQRAVTQHMCRTQAMRFNDRALTLLKILDRTPSLPADTIGLPMMFMKNSLCVCNDVLVVGDDSTTATYVLSIDKKNNPGALNLQGVTNIRITNIFTEDEYNRIMSSAEASAAAAATSAAKAPAATAVPSLSSLLRK